MTPELTLADVERLEEKRARYRQHRQAKPSDIFSDEFKLYERTLNTDLWRFCDALLALAREALDRREASVKAIAERDAYKAALASLSSVLLELQEAMLAGRVEMDDAARAAVAIGLDRVSEALEA